MLIDTETAQSAHPEIDGFVCERIVGQMQTVVDQAIPRDHFLHHRVYVAPTNSAATALRSLNSADEAESSFLWHQVEPCSAALNGFVYGTWSGETSSRPGGRQFMGRFGHIDIRVGRRLEGGEALIWHTQIVNPPAADNTFGLKLWLRLLVREA